MSLGKTPALRLERILDLEAGLELTTEQQVLPEVRTAQQTVDFFSHYTNPSAAKRIWEIYLSEFGKNQDITVEELDEIREDLLSFNNHDDLDLYLNSLLVSANQREGLNIPAESYKPRFRDDWPVEVDSSVVLSHFIGTPTRLKKPLFYTDGKGNSYLVE